MKPTNLDEQILRASKEIVVKFIEVGRISPTGFADTFRSVYRTICQAVDERRADRNDAPPG